MDLTKIQDRFLDKVVETIDQQEQISLGGKTFERITIDGKEYFMDINDVKYTHNKDNTRIYVQIYYLSRLKKSSSLDMNLNILTSNLYHNIGAKDKLDIIQDTLNTVACITGSNDDERYFEKMMIKNSFEGVSEDRLDDIVNSIDYSTVSVVKGFDIESFPDRLREIAIFEPNIIENDAVVYSSVFSFGFSDRWRILHKPIPKEFIQRNYSNLVFAC